MKHLILLLSMMTNTTTSGEPGKATTEKKTFSRSTTISQDIHARPEIIWGLLVDAKAFPEWNSTVISIEGEIKEGSKIKLKSTLDPSRTFKLKVSEAIPNTRMIWSDMMGQRTYTLKVIKDGTRFTMHEKIGGPIFPLFASKIPPFDASFEQFVKDLKTKAEALTQNQ